MNDLRLPEGFTCGDCAFFAEYCKSFVSCNPQNKTCDWDPIRFEFSLEKVRELQARVKQLETREPFPVIMGRPITRKEIIEGLREAYQDKLKLERKYVDSSLVSYPDAENVLDYIETHGLPPKSATEN